VKKYIPETRLIFLLFTLLFVGIFFSCSIQSKKKTCGCYKNDKVTEEEDIITDYCIAVDDTVVFIRKSDTSHLAFPDIIKLPNDSLLVVYREGINHIDITGAIIGQIGSPDGKNWNPPFVFYDNLGIDDRDPSLFIDENETIWMNHFRYISGEGNEKPTICHIHVNNFDKNLNHQKSIQVDKGLYLYDSLFINSRGVWESEKFDEISVYGCSSGITKTNNTMLFAGYGGYPLVRIPGTKEFSSPVSHIKLFSKPKLKDDWVEFDVNIPDSDTVWLQEPSILKISDSTLIMHVRTAYGNSIFSAGQMAQTISKDGGKTWSSLNYFDFVGHSPELFRHSSGIIFCGFRLMTEEYTKENTAFIYSKNNGASWSEPVVVESCEECECAYPAFVEINYETLLMVYYSDDGRSIKGKYIKVFEH
jgi:hypothetical protein